jgi:CHAD domain-containing protein
VATASAVERELKFEAGSEFALPDLTALVPGGEVRALPPRRLEATYYDTADLRLARWGVTLRHRTGDDQPLWTVKLAAEDDKPDLRARHEISQPGPGDGPVPDDLAALVQAYARHEPLVQVARLVTRRVRFALHGPDGAPVAEVDDDEVVAYQRRKVVARFREIEAELDEAAVANGLARNVSRTFRKAGATPSLQGNKLLRALTGDLAADALAPELSVDGLGRHATVGELVRSAMANGARRLLVHDPLVRLDADIEAVHQARVATRRMRSDLKTFKQFVAPAWADPLGEELKWLGAVLGAVRDADVLGERMRDHVEALPEEDRKPAGRVLATLAAEREAAFAALQEAMASERYVDLLDAVVQAGQAPVLTDAAASQDGAEALRGVVGKRWKRLRADAKAAGDADEALHGVRIAAKRTRYAAEAGRAVLGKPGNALASASADVQSVLGDLHDAVVAEGWLRGVARSRLASATAVAVGLLIAREQQAAAEARAAWPEKWADAKQAWHDFNRSS